MEPFVGSEGEYNFAHSYLTATFREGKMKEYDDGVQFEGSFPTLFCIPYSCTFELLTELVTKSLNLQIATNINKLYFRQPMFNENGVVMYHATELACDEDDYV